MFSTQFKNLFYLNQLTYLLIFLILFIGLVVASFSYRYLKGDVRKKRFFTLYSLFILSMVVWVSSDQFILFLGSLASANFLLTKLMGHNVNWKAARASSQLALTYFLYSLLAMSLAFYLFYYQLGVTSIHELTANFKLTAWTSIAISLLFLSSLIQSGLWPFHRWLLSSLNSPTPVSAIMHAGLVNGGGVILTRFSSLYLQSSTMLSIIFLVGLVSVLMGTLWKLIQSDIKRLLACSTMSQMGFMFVQCGLGLFPAAIAHLFFHGLFKAYLFLNIGGAARAEKFPKGDPQKGLKLLVSLVSAALAAALFSMASGKSILKIDSSLVLTFVAFIAAFQMVSALQYKASVKTACLALGSSAFMGLLYGFNVRSIEHYLVNLNLMHPQSFNGVHFFGIFLMSLFWLGYEFKLFSQSSELSAKFYVKLLNSSQPHPNTVTPNRNTYTVL